MLIKAMHQITKISDNETINISNYIESISYINNLYIFLNNMNDIAICNFDFEPTFKGLKTCKQFNIVSNEYENTMKHFLIKSELFLEDNELKNMIENKMGVLCKSIIFNKNTIEFILR